jgi:LmbE family N-acetylglucosaminyl deacetylase
MIRLSLDGVRRILCLGAHCDDIEIGCGGTLLRLTGADPRLQVHWVVFSSTEARAAEAQRSAARFLEKTERRTVEILDYQDGFLPFLGRRVKTYLEELKGRLSPDLVFTPCRRDLHQDHRLVGRLTWTVFRGPLILEYEIPKWDGDLGRPNFFVQLDPSICRRKVQILLESYPSQREKRWFEEELFLGLMRLRGMESGAPSRYAEGFYCRKAAL